MEIEVKKQEKRIIGETQRIAVSPEVFALVNGVKRGANVTYDVALLIVFGRVKRPDETPLQMGERLARENADAILKSSKKR